MRNLFTYGSLMCIDIMSQVAGRCHVVGNARLHGYRCLAVKGETYPAIVAADGHVTAGILYGGISDDGFRRLDDFEGEMYLRTVVQVVLPSGNRIDVFTYIFKPEFSGLLTDDDWKFDTFLKQEKANFISKYKGFLRI